AQAPTTSTAATVVATTPAPANASALRLTGFGALDADWDARHTMVRTPGATPGAAYDPLTDWSSRFDGVEHTQGRVVGFGMNWLEPGVEWRVARDEVLALLPPDAVLVEEGPCSEGKHFLFHSATLGEAFDAGDALQTSDGDRIGSGGYVVVGLYSFDGPFTGDIDTAIVMIGSEHLNPNGC
ncbi:MAG: hypothetical protein Q8M79_09235, partial [Dehalococcoidia bacterium]|nr:hypothetical protein [Dehalococcoidia bacterium]